MLTDSNFLVRVILMGADVLISAPVRIAAEETNVGLSAAQVEPVMLRLCIR
jgi:hypothetical protein